MLRTTSTVSSRHYHIIAGNANGVPYSESKFEDYDESIDKLTTLSVTLFGHLFPDDKISFERFISVTEHGEGQAIMVGTPHLCICWWPCERCQPIVSN